MAEIIDFTHKWYQKNPDGIEVSVGQAYRYINIIASDGFRALAKTLVYKHSRVTEIVTSLNEEFSHVDEIINITNDEDFEILKTALKFKLVEADSKKNFIKLTYFGNQIKPYLEHSHAVNRKRKDVV